MRVLIASVDIFTVASIKLTSAKENVMYDTTDLSEDGLYMAKLYDYDIILLDLPPRTSTATKCCSGCARRVWIRQF